MTLAAAIIPVTPFQQNCALIWDQETKRGVVIDPGGDVARIEGAIAEAGITIDRILLTHGHMDHAGGAAELAEAAPVAGPDGQAAPMTLEQAVERHLASFMSAHKEGMPVKELYDRVLAEVERPLLRMALSATRGNQIKAAAMLGLNRNTLRKKLRELELPVVRGA